MQLVQIDPNYLSYLRQTEPRVPEKEGRLWLFPVNIGAITYAIPLTTKEPTAGYAGYIRSEIYPDRGLNLRFMVPVPDNAWHPVTASHEQTQELLMYEQKGVYIRAEANLLHRLYCANQMHPNFSLNCCNYKKMEHEYSAWTPGQQTGHFLYPKTNKQEVPAMAQTPNQTRYANIPDEAYEFAKYGSSALEYARSRGYDLVRHGSSGAYHLREHDSMIFTANGGWFWNSRGMSGGAIDFMMVYEGKTFRDAVMELAESQGRGYQTSAPHREPGVPKQWEREKPEFSLPQVSENFKWLFYYLCNSRGLDKGVVKHLVDNELVYQSKINTVSGKTKHNACFVYYDKDGKPCGGFQRGMESYGKPFKKDLPGSDKSYGWLIKGAQPSRLFVFEGAIDAASYVSLQKMNGSDPFRDADYLALGGLQPAPLLKYLEQHPDIKHITLMLDSDEPGRRATESFRSQLTGRDLKVDTMEPPFGKDWNETLLHLIRPEEQRTVKAQEPEAVNNAIVADIEELEMD